MGIRLLRTHVLLAFTVLVTAGGWPPSGGSYEFSTLAGDKGGYRDAKGTAARFRAPEGIAVDRRGNVYVTEYWNSTVRKIAPDGTVTTIGGKAGVTGAVDGPAAESVFNRPHGIAVDDRLAVYVSDMKNHTIRVISPSGVVSTLAGKAGESGVTDGSGNHARFRQPEDVAVDGRGNVYVADTYNFTVRKITRDGIVTTLAGKAGVRGSADGAGSEARFSMPLGVDVDANGFIYVADGDFDGKERGNCTIRKITPEGIVTTLAGKAGQAGSEDGAREEARFTEPVGIAVARDGSVFIADTGAHTLRRVSPDGKVTTIGGLFGKRGRSDGIGKDARFNAPQSVAVDERGHLYVADTFNHLIRRGVPRTRRHPPVPVEPKRGRRRY